jgi:hypothetical protein
VFDGGTRTFTLGYTQEGGITVTLNVQPYLTGAAVFLVERGEDGAEYLTRKDTGDTTFNYTSPTAVSNPAPFTGMCDALVWADYNTTSNQEWLIRVEAAETAIPRMLLSGGTPYGRDPPASETGNTDGNITIRLRGYGGTEHIVKYVGVDDKVYQGRFSNLARGTSQAPGLISLRGFSTDDDKPGLTFQLEKGVTLQGTMNTQPGSKRYFGMVYLSEHSMLVMKDGSKITGHYKTANAGTNSGSDARYPIIAIGGDISPAKKADWPHYRVVIEAGAQITGNQLAPIRGDINSVNASFCTVINVYGGAAGEEGIPLPAKPLVFISKDAVISNNVREGDDNVNIFRVWWGANGSKAINYDIKAPCSDDLILPLAEHRSAE